MKTKLLSLVLVLTSMAACHKDSEIFKKKEINDSASTNYHPLTIGSYWIYDVYSIDMNGSETYLFTDTTRIIGDTIIGGKKYAIKKGKNFGIPFTQFLRNTPGYLLDKNGIIKFSSTNFTDTLHTLDHLPNFIIYHMMDHKDTLIGVPAGVFISSAYKYIGYWGKPPIPEPRFEYDYYSDGVGIVQSTHFFGFFNQYTHEERLIDYLITK